MKPWIALALALLCVSPAPAQYTDDDDLEDQRKQDERYYQRYVDRSEDDAPDSEQDEAEQARAFLERADALIRDKNYRSRITGDFEVKTDDPRIDLDAVTRLLGSFAGFFDSFWSGRTGLRPAPGPTRVFLFYSYYKYNQLLEGDWSRSWMRPKGHYGVLFDALVLHTDSDRPGVFANTLIHEAAHQLVERRLFDGTGRAPAWLSEGLASYFGETFMDGDGSFEPGTVGGKRIALLKNERARAATDIPDRLRGLRRALKEAQSEGDSLSARVIGSRDPGAFYGGDVVAHYTLSWVLVHYMLHGDEGTHADAFVRYLAHRAGEEGVEGEPFEELGLDPATLDGVLLRHAESIRVR